MNDYSVKKSKDGFLVSRKGSSFVQREKVDNRDRNSQHCNRIGCNGIRNSSIGTQISCSGKAKSSRPSLRSSSSGKEIIGASSRTRSTINTQRKHLQEPRRKLSSQLETDSSESGGVQEEAEVSAIVGPIGKIQRRSHTDYDIAGTSQVISSETGSSNVGSSTMSRRTLYRKSRLGNRDVLACSTTSLTSISQRCNAISDVARLSSSPGAYQSKRKGMASKGISDGESISSTRGKKIGGSTLELRNSSLSSGISVSGSRRLKTGSSNKSNGASSVRTRRAINSHLRARPSGLGSKSNISRSESSHVVAEMSQSLHPLAATASPSSYQSSLETSLSRSRSFCRRRGNSSENLRGVRPLSPVEIGNNRPMINRENFRRYNVDGIAEMLRAREWIEQDEELSYEESLVDWSLNGQNFSDQHREMRLDIDNMSYEELLALGEMMGSVSTALTEVAISECIKTGVYHSAALDDSNSDFGHDKDDVKCSICQEEYAEGDEVGRLRCEHFYHVDCIQHWLRLKNWCPICKSSAASPSSPEPSKLAE